MLGRSRLLLIGTKWIFLVDINLILLLIVLDGTGIVLKGYVCAADEQYVTFINLIT